MKVDVASLEELCWRHNQKRWHIGMNCHTTLKIDMKRQRLPSDHKHRILQVHLIMSNLFINLNVITNLLD